MYIIGISKHFVPKGYAWCSSKLLLIWKFYLFGFLDKKCPNTSQLHTKSVRYFRTPVKIKLIYYFITSMFEFVSNCSNIYFQSYYSEIFPSYYLKYSVHKSSEESFRQEKKNMPLLFIQGNSTVNILQFAQAFFKKQIWNIKVNIFLLFPEIFQKNQTFNSEIILIQTKT